MATWCASCKKEAPQVALLRDRFKGSGVPLYGVPTDPQDDGERLSAYVRAQEPAYTLLADLSRDDARAIDRIVEESLGTVVLPATVVTDPEGRVLHVQAGVPSVSTVRHLLAGLP
jgi:peroxiredoxin